MEVVDKVEGILAEVEPTDSVLDVGYLNHSVEGYERSPLHKRLEEKCEDVWGIDILGGPPRGAKGNLRKGDITDLRDVLPLFRAHGEFDVIVAGDVIEHLTDLRNFFEYCNRLLKTGGKLVITTPNPFYLDGIVFAWLKGKPLNNPDHTCWLDPYLLFRTVASFGLLPNGGEKWLKSTWQLPAFILMGRRWQYSHWTASWKCGNNTIRRSVAGLLWYPWKVLRWLLTIKRPLLRYGGFMMIGYKK